MENQGSNGSKNGAAAAATAHPTTASAAASQTQDSPEMQPAADADYLQKAQGQPQSFTSEEEAYMLDILNELDLLTHKEKKPNAEAAQAQQGQQVMGKLKTGPDRVLKPPQDILLGILGPCALKGHIVHFFNLRFDIEKHIRTVSELTDPRFVAAYQYLKQNPSVDAVFVYENRMAAAFAVAGGIRFRPI